MGSAVNPVDLAVAAVLLVSALMAFARGFVREVLSVAAWIGAALITIYAFPYVQPLAESKISNKLTADVAGIAGTFLLSLILLSMVSHRLSRNVRDSALSAIDRSLGFAFGVARGAILVSLAYMFAIWLWTNPADQPVWLQGAKSRPALARGAQALMALVPNSVRSGAEKEALDRAGEIDVLKKLSTSVPANLANSAAKAAGSAAEAAAGAAAESLLGTGQGGRTQGGPASKAGVQEGDRGYNDQERSGLDRLIENNERR